MNWKDLLVKVGGIAGWLAAIAAGLLCLSRIHLP